MTRTECLVACLLAGFVTIGSQGAIGAIIATDQRTGCQLYIPATWRSAAIHWSGGCRGGSADGLGVVVEYVDGKSKDSFFGEIADGLMARGVIETADGYRTVRFVGGDPISTDDRDEIIAAFRIASNAAQAASDQFRAAGNAASARYYTKAAERLANQMD